MPLKIGGYAYPQGPLFPKRVLQTFAKSFAVENLFILVVSR